jgi:hypothetical protein
MCNQSAMTNPEKNIQDTVMQRISSGEVCLRSRRWFTCLACFVYTLWLVSVLVGSLALGIVFYITINGWYGLYEATELTRTGLILSAVPYVWIVTLLVTVGLAYYNVRKTSKGYKYPVWLVLSASLGASFLGGAAVYMFGFAQHMDMHLGHVMPDGYTSYYMQQEAFWQTPADNRWLGTVSASTTFTDFSGTTWMIIDTELTTAERDLLHAGKQVKVVGTSTVAGSLTACGVFPWFEAAPLTRRNLSEHRALLVTRLEDMKFDTKPCSELALVRKMP